MIIDSQLSSNNQYIKFLDSLVVDYDLLITSLSHKDNEQVRGKIQLILNILDESGYSIQHRKDRLPDSRS